MLRIIIFFQINIYKHKTFSGIQRKICLNQLLCIKIVLLCIKNVLLCIKNATKEMESPLKIYLVDSLRNITYLIFFLFEVFW